MFFSLSVIWIGAVFYSPLPTMLIKPLEDRISARDVPPDVKGIIVLSGGLEVEISKSRSSVEFAIAADRLVQAGILAARYPDAKIIYSGGSGEPANDEPVAADIAHRYLQSIGIQEERIILEKEARNTVENVRLTKALINPQENDNYVLITSAFHMPRSIGLFRAQNWDVTPFPVDYRTSKNDVFGSSTRSELDNFINMRTALKEWVGLISYYMLGRIEEIFPQDIPE